MSVVKGLATVARPLLATLISDAMYLSPAPQTALAIEGRQRKQANRHKVPTDDSTYTTCPTLALFILESYPAFPSSLLGAASTKAVIVLPTP